MITPKPNALPWLALSVLVIVLDQWSKHWVLASLPEYTAVTVIDGFWNWYRTYNTGAAFSFLSDAGGWQKYFFVVLAAGISGLLGYWLWRTPRGDWKTALPYALELAALRRLAAETFSILVSTAPAVAALVGWLLLGQALGPLELWGMGLVILASVAAVRSGPRPGRRTPEDLLPPAP